MKRAESQILAHRFDKGIEAYLEAYDSDPADFHPLILAGDLHVNLGENDKAVRILMRAARGYAAQGRPTETLLVYRKVHRLLPNDPEVLIALSELCFKTNARPDALRYVADAAKRALEPAGAPPVDTTYILRLTGLVEQAVKGSTDPELVILQSRLYENVGRDEEAFALYRQASEALAEEGKLERSLAILNHLLNKRPSDATLVEALTRTMTKLGRPLEALALQKQMLENNPDDVRLLKVMVHTLIALEYYDEAEQACYKLYLLDRSFYHEFLQFVYQIISRQDYNRAVRCVKEMIPSSTYLQKTEMAYVLKRILELSPHHIPTLTTLAEIHERYNDIVQVLKVYPVLFDLLYREGNVMEAYHVGQRMVELGYKEQGFIKHYDKIFTQIAGGPGSAPGMDDTMGAPSDATSNGSVAHGAGNDSNSKMSWGKPSGPVESEDSLVTSVELLVRYGHHENAIQVLKSHLETDPRSITLHETLKSVYLSTQLISNAAKECIELYKLYLERGLRDKAQASLREALKLEPTLSLKTLEGGKETTTGFVGDFGLFTIVEVIQFLEQSCKTGVLKIVSSTEEGRLLFNSGQVVDAVVGDKGGIQALYHLIRVEVGSYEFEPRNNKFPEKIRVNTMHLLLEGLRLLDEERARKSTVTS